MAKKPKVAFDSTDEQGFMSAASVRSTKAKGEQGFMSAASIRSAMAIEKKGSELSPSRRQGDQSAIHAASQAPGHAVASDMPSKTLEQNAPRSLNVHQPSGAPSFRQKRHSIMRPDDVRDAAVERKDSQESNDKRVASSADDPLQALSAQPFFEGLKMATIVSLSKIASQKKEDAIAKAAADCGRPGIIIQEGETTWASDMLWIIEKGSVDIFENGEKLGKLRAGDIFGAAVAFGHLEVQPFTIKLHGAQDDAYGHRPSQKLVCWCIPNNAVSHTIRQFPEAKMLLEERAAYATIRSLSSRLSKLLFFQHCGHGFIESLLPKMPLSFFQKGAEIIQGSEEADTMLIILSGSARLGSMFRKKSIGSNPPGKPQSEIPREPSSVKWIGRATRAKTEESLRGHHASSGAQEKSSGSRTVATSGSADSIEVPQPSSPSWVSRMTVKVSMLSPVTEDDKESPDVKTNDQNHRGSWLKRFRSSRTGIAPAATEDDVEAPSSKITEDEQTSPPSTQINDADSAFDSSESSSSSSSDESFLSEDGDFLPPKSLERGQIKLLSAGPEALCFGEGILLGLQGHHGRPVVAGSDCIVAALHRDDFIDQVERHPREEARFEQMAAVKYQEWRRSDIARLASAHLFSKCSDAFLALVIQHAEMQLFFAEDEIISEGLVPKGLLLLMSGKAQCSEKGEIQSPESYGTLEWLGVSGSTQSCNVKAKGVCLVLTVSREHLLDALKDHPHESTVIVQQVLRQKNIRMSLNSGLELLIDNGSQQDAAARKHRNLRQSVWHLPFCKGCDPDFVGRLTRELKVCKLVPGQVIFSPAPQKSSQEPHGHSQPASTCQYQHQHANTNEGHHRHHHHHHHNTAEEPDFLVILINGTAQVDETPHRPQRGSDPTRQTWKQVQAPLVMVGFNRKHRAMMVTSTVCEVHRLTIPAIARLAEEHQTDLKRVLRRMLLFTQHREEQLKSSWWCATKSLRYQAWFKDSDEHFLQELSKKLETELFMPGEVLVLEGDPVESTMLLECGTAAIENFNTRSLYSNDRIGEVHDGYWIGEMAMFTGESKRRATIRAITMVKIQRLYNKELVRLLGEFPKERQRFRQLAEHRLRAVEKEQLEHHTFFKTFDHTFLNLLRQKCRAHVFFAGEVLMTQGELADSLFILGRDSYVTLTVDGCHVKKLMGRACLGTKALLSSRPVKRASTVTTQTVCAVRTLTREDWLDALKLHPEHQKWLSSFTRDQMVKVNDARATFRKKRAWEKIHQRETVATAMHCERFADPELYVRSQRKLHSRCLPQLSYESQSQAVPWDFGLSLTLGSDRPETKEEFSSTTASKVAQSLPEIWECFNDCQTIVPHTRLPQLAHGCADPYVVDLGDLGELGLLRSDSCESFSFEECEEALGLASQS